MSLSYEYIKHDRRDILRHAKVLEDDYKFYDEA